MTSGEILDSFVADFIGKPESRVSYIYYPIALARSHFTASDKRFHLYNMKTDLSPMAPFFEIIKSKNPSDELIDKLSYPLHNPLWKSYLRNGVVCDRKDEVIVEEIKYEQNELSKTIHSFLDEFDSDVYVILNAQWLCNESLKLFEELEKSDVKSKFILIFDSTIVKFDKSYTAEFIERKQYQENFINIYTHQEVAPEKISKKDIAKVSDVINAIKNVRAFLVTTDIIRICNQVENFIDKIPMSAKKRRDLYLEMGSAYIIAGYTDEACLYLSKVIDEKRNDEAGAIAMYELAKAYYIKKMNGAAFRYAKYAQKFYANVPKSKIFALSSMIQYFASDRGDVNYISKKYRQSIKLLREAGLINNYVNTVLNVPGPFINNLKILEEEVQPMILDCYYAVSNLRNQLGLSYVCNWLGIIYSREGNRSEAYKMYNECSQIRQLIGDLVYIIRVRNSLSYEALIQADYKQAYELINEYSERFNEIDNYRTIINTLRNMAIPLMYSRHFDEAGRLFTIIVQLMNMFDFEYNSVNSFLPELNDITLYRSVIELSKSEYSHIQVNLYSILNNGKYISPAIKPLLNFLEAVLFLKDGNYIDAVDLFDVGMTEDNELGEANAHIICFCCYEFAVVLKKFGYEELSDNYLKKGFEFAKEKGFAYYTKGKEEINILDYLCHGEKLSEFKVNLEDIKKNALAEKLKNQIHSRVLASQFLNSITTAGVETKDQKHYLAKVLPQIVDYAMADGVIVVTKNNGKWKISDGICKDDVKAEILDDVLVCERAARNFDPCHVFYEKVTNRYYCNISKYNFTAGMIIIPGGMGQINSELLSILGIACSYIQAQLVLYGQKINLIQASVYDSLTSLKNRRALSDYISDQRDKVKEVSIQYTFGFIDLDNFKYFNDTFGHAAGDLMLKLFAKVLRKVYRTGDFLCRFGGDEFVVVIPAANCEEVSRSAKRLYKALKEEQYFIPALEDLMEKKIYVPEEYHLGFSMGLCSNFDIEDTANLKLVMKNADDALYYSKGHGKSRVTIWSEVKDQIREAIKDESKL